MDRQLNYATAFWRAMGTAALVAAGCPGVRAQVSNFHYSGGVGVVALRSTGPTLVENIGSTTYSTYELKTTDTNVLVASAAAGFDAPLLQFGKGEQGLGVSLNASFGLLTTAPQEAGGFNGRYLLDFPQYLTYRYGAKASKHSKKDFGVGVGVGYRFCKFALPFSAPSAMLEGVYSSTGADWFIRLSTDLRPRRFYNDYSSEGLVEVLSIREIQLQVGRSF
jgi:hypothetical protein